MKRGTQIKNKFGQIAKIIDIEKANYSNIYIINKKIKGCSVVSGNGIKYFFWEKDLVNLLTTYTLEEELR